jgi:fermentation-respiration switch protein FrsA (DUF1100 family)
MLVSLLVAVAVAYLATIALLFFTQGRLIYPVPPAQAVPAGYAPIELRTDDGLTVVAGHRPARDGKPTVLFFHGNGMVWPEGAWLMEPLAAQGYGVLLAEYRGYNDNPGRPSEQGLYRDARAALAWLERKGVPAAEVVLVGLSVGSGPAVQLATEARPRALVLVSPVASLPAAAAATYPWLPARWLVRDKYDNLAKLAGVEAPILVLHGEADELIPLAHAEALARAHPRARLVTFPGRGHNMAGDPAVQQAQNAFVLGLENRSVR